MKHVSSLMRFNTDSRQAYHGRADESDLKELRSAECAAEGSANLETWTVECRRENPTQSTLRVYSCPSWLDYSVFAGDGSGRGDEMVTCVTFAPALRSASSLTALPSSPF